MGDACYRPVPAGAPGSLFSARSVPGYPHRAQNGRHAHVFPNERTTVQA